MDVEHEELVGETHRGRAFGASVRAGIRDLKDYPSIVTMTVVTVLLGTAMALLGPLLRELTEAGDTYVTMNSEILVLAQPDFRGDLAEVSAALSGMDGVNLVREATRSDLEALPPNQQSRFQSGDPLVIEPTGRVPVQAIHHQVEDVPGVASVALGVGVPSQWTIELVENLVPWLAVAFLVGAILLVANLSFMTARSRAEEAEAMRLVGASTLSVWIRIFLVTAIPTVFVVALTTGAIATAGPSIAAWLLPEGATMVGATNTILASGLLLGGAALLVASVASLAAVWRVVTK